VTVVLKPGVKVRAADVTHYFAPAEFNPAHTKYIARSPKAKPMAVNMYSGFWTFCVCVVVVVGVSLFTTPKTDKELTNLVMGLTPLPDEGPTPWYKHPYLWATLVFIVLVAINIIFW
jgi:SSS family solute:Na+ symporter